MAQGRRTAQLAAKRLIDLVVSALALLALSPVLLLIALAVKLTSRGPVFFRQVRVGREGREFRILKFRTMVVGAEQLGTGLRTSAGDARITWLGRGLRASSLDELPQLLNVLAGQMSLVGPRPTVPSQVANYGPFERRRLEMLPGLTSLAVVRGRNEIPWPVRIQHDVEYIDRFSLWLDFKIVLATVVVLVSRRGLYLPEHVKSAASHPSPDGGPAGNKSDDGGRKAR